VKIIGYDPEDLITIYIIGYAYYSFTNDERKVLRDYAFKLFDYLTDRHKLKVIYFSSQMTGLQKGAISDCRKTFAKLKEEKWSQLQSFNVIHPTFYIKARIATFRTFCLIKSAQPVRYVKTFNRFADYLDNVRDSSERCSEVEEHL